MTDQTVDVTMRFPNEKVKHEFFAWLCDGGGEQDFFQSAEWHIPEEDVCNIQYHPVHEEYPLQDPRRSGEFLEDNLVIVHKLKE